MIDFVGMPATSQLGRDAMRKGGTQVQVGLYGGQLDFDIGGFATQHKHLMGNFVGTLDEFVELMWVIPLPLCSTVCSRGLASLPADTSHNQGVRAVRREERHPNADAADRAGE